MGKGKWLLKKGDKVKFKIKDENVNKLVQLEGVIKRIMSSKEAKLKGYLKGKKTGRVFEIEIEDGSLYYKFQKVIEPV